jgi:hypothetical protein
VMNGRKYTNRTNIKNSATSTWSPCILASFYSGQLNSVVSPDRLV